MRVEIGVLERAFAGQVTALVAPEVLRPITESERDMTWAAGEVLDEADLMVDRLRLG